MKKLQNWTHCIFVFNGLFTLSASSFSVFSANSQNFPKKLRTLKPLQITKNKEITSDKTAIHREAISNIAKQITKNFIPSANVIF